MDDKFCQKAIVKAWNRLSNFSQLMKILSASISIKQHICSEIVIDKFLTQWLFGQRTSDISKAFSSTDSFMAPSPVTQRAPGQCETWVVANWGFVAWKIHWLPAYWAEDAALYRWFSARPQYLQCIGNGDTAVLH